MNIYFNKIGDKQMLQHTYHFYSKQLLGMLSLPEHTDAFSFLFSFPRRHASPKL